MRVTVNEVLKLKSFRQVKVISGVQGLNNDVGNVYVMEVPDISSYVGKNGLLFTTLYPIADDEQALKSFIPNLVDLGLSGVGIKIGRYLDEIPEYMVKQADELGLPILALPSDANLSTLTNDILTQLLGMKTKELEFRESISAKLHTLLLSGADIKDLVEYVSVITGKDIMVVSSQFKLIDSSINLQKNEVVVHSAALKESDSNRAALTTSVPLVSINKETYLRDELILHPIDAGEKLLGYIILTSQESSKNKLDEYLSVIIEQAVILLAFLLQNRQALLQKERNYLDNFIRDSINQQYDSQADLIQKAKVFKWNLHFPNIIMLIDIDEESPEKRLSYYYKILDSGIITDELSRQLEIPRENCKVALYETHIICFISVALLTSLYSRLDKAGNILIKRLKTYSHVRVSFSNKFFSSSEIKNAYEEANLVQNIYKEISLNKSSINFYKDLGMYKLFHLIDDKESLKSFVNEKIGPIIESDENNSMHLIMTLKTLIAHNMNLKKSAEALFIHYNSLRYRVNKLKDLGINLEDGNELAELAVACQLLTYLNDKQ